MFLIRSNSESRSKIHGIHAFAFFRSRFRTLLETTDFNVKQNFKWVRLGKVDPYRKKESITFNPSDIHGMGWILPDGNRLRYMLISRYTCRHEWDYQYFRIHGPDKTPSDEPIAEKILIKLFDKPVRRKVPSRCRSAKAEDRDTHYTAKWHQLGGVFNPLADSTILFHNNSSPTIIRVRRDFTSPYIEASPNLFVMTRPAYLALLERAVKMPGRLSQNMDDAVYLHLMKTRKDKTQGK